MRSRSSAKPSDNAETETAETVTEGEHGDAIVVGSGFGGAVAAARLAQAGFSVTVLERGRRWLPGQFPRSTDLEEGWLWQAGHGLYDLRWLNSMLSLQAAGWGGGSLVYANVFARPAAQTQDDRWPTTLRREALDPYYDLAGTMLGVTPVQPDPRTGVVPTRTNVVEDIVEQTQVRPAMVRPNLAVRFGASDTWSRNLHGVPQRGCAFLGECVLGCNRSAKNSLDLNYLAVAEQHGATGVTGAEVTRIAPNETGWSVWSKEGEGSEGNLVQRRATQLILAAGSVATTELLLRSRDIDQTLPNLSATLGRGFSGNGDQLALAHIRRGDGDLTTGPTITTTTVLDVWERSKPVWFQVQDGAVPVVISDMLDRLLPLQRLRAWWSRLRRNDPTRTLALLSMGHDSGTGRLELDNRGQARLRWANRWQARLYRAEERVGPLITRVTGSRVRSVIPWSIFKKPVTVHPLGGVPAGDSSDTGVVGRDLQVHGHPGLYVMDGAVLPASTGANPSATILAGAEHAIEGLIRTLTGDSSWRAPEWDRVRPVPAPEDEAYEWIARRRRDTAGDGIVFDEHMHERVPGSGRAGDLQVRLEIASLDRFHADPEHRLAVDGTITLAQLPGTLEMTGQLHMFPADGKPLMRYELRATDPDGQIWIGEAIKSQRGRGPLARYRSLTSAELVLRSESDPSVSIRTSFVLHPHNVLGNGLSLRGRGFTFPRRAQALMTFSVFFITGVLGLRRRGEGG
ncbi:FAD-dependent oxidoreductase [Brevibacterium picturae]|uniref:Cholesterol oxidase n=1 Tax=Brevibacterium picturae TaxID=260553 RepID=A0ABP4NCZ8_9MICO